MRKTKGGAVPLSSFQSLILFFEAFAFSIRRFLAGGSFLGKFG